MIVKKSLAMRFCTPGFPRISPPSKVKSFLSNGVNTNQAQAAFFVLRYWKDCCGSLNTQIKKFCQGFFLVFFGGLYWVS
jgi:hypothetical protein